MIPNVLANHTMPVSANSVKLCMYVLIFGLTIPFILGAVSFDKLPALLHRYLGFKTAQDVLISIATTHRYTVQVLSRDPVMIYLDEFIHPLEAEYLVNLG